MKEAIKINDKKRYINWFLKTYRLKRPELAAVLGFLTEREEQLAKTHFVENVRRLPNALIISAIDAPTVSFLCRINGSYYENVNEILAILDRNPPDELFVWLSFDREFMCSMCKTVLEVKPEVKDRIFYHQVINGLEDEIHNNYGLKEKRKAELMDEINDALRLKDRNLFYYLSAIYKDLA